MIVLTVLGLVGLIIFIVFALVWLIGKPARTQAAPLAVVGLLIWAIATVIAGLIGLF